MLKLTLFNLKWKVDVRLNRIKFHDHERDMTKQRTVLQQAILIGYDRNRIIRLETGTEPEFRFWLTGTGMGF